MSRTRAVGVVEDGQVGDQRHRQLGHAEVVGARLGQPLQPADDVVAQVADQPAGERGQAGHPGRPEPAGQRPDGGQRVVRQVVGEAGHRVAQPLRDAVPLGQDAGAAHPDEAVPRPPLALLGRLQQHGARPVAGQLAVDADGGLAVGEQPAGDRHHGTGPTRPVRAGANSSRLGLVTPNLMRGSPRRPGSPRWKQLRSPVWQAGPSWSTSRSSASPSQSRRTSRTHWRCPEVSPFTQYSPRLRDQYVARPVVRVRCSASSSIQASMSTSPVSCCCTTAATSPAGSRRSSVATAGSSAEAADMPPSVPCSPGQARAVPSNQARPGPSRTSPSPTSGADGEDQREGREGALVDRARDVAQHRVQADPPVGREQRPGPRAPRRAAARRPGTAGSAPATPATTSRTAESSPTHDQDLALGGERLRRVRVEVAGRLPGREADQRHREPHVERGEEDERGLHEGEHGRADHLTGPAGTRRRAGDPRPG